MILLALAAVAAPPVLLKPARVFDGITPTPHAGWVVLVSGDRIAAVGPPAEVKVPTDTTTVELPGLTLLPGLIDAHSHLLLHPYDEAPWDRQVLFEPLGERVARATVHARANLLSGFTTLRDLGTKGAGDAEVFRPDAGRGAHRRDFDGGDGPAPGRQAGAGEGRAAGGCDRRRRRPDGRHRGGAQGAVRDEGRRRPQGAVTPPVSREAEALRSRARAGPGSPATSPDGKRRPRSAPKTPPRG